MKVVSTKRSSLYQLLGVARQNDYVLTRGVVDHTNAAYGVLSECLRIIFNRDELLENVLRVGKPEYLADGLDV